MSQRKKSRSLSTVDPDELKELYVTKQLSIPKVAIALDISISSVWNLLSSNGIQRRYNGHYDVKEAWSLYAEQGLNLREIAERFGVSRQAVHQKLIYAGYDIKIPKVAKNLPDAERLRELYVDQNLPIRAIVDELQSTINYVMKAIEHYGYTRPSKRRKKIDREIIEELYVGQKLLMREVADRLGISRGNVLAELQRHNITFRHPPARKINKPSREVLETLYKQKNISLEEIGRRLGVSSTTVTNLARSYGFEPRRSVASQLDLKNNRDLLFDLYVNRGLRTSHIAKMYGVSHYYVDFWLKKHRIEKRPRQIALEYDLLKKLIIDEDLTYKQAGERIGVSHKVVRREAKKHAIVDKNGRAKQSTIS